MAIFRRRKDKDDPPPPEPLSPSDEQSGDAGDGVAGPRARGRNRSEDWNVPDLPSSSETQERAGSLEARLLDSLGPRDRLPPPPTGDVDDTSGGADSAAPAATAVVRKDRPTRPNPGTDVARAIRRAVTRALAEDLGDQGDVTAAATVLPGLRGTANIVAREDGVVAGIDLVIEAFAHVDARVVVDAAVQDGDRVTAGQALATVEGPLRSILTGERVALNFLGHLSGIATTTARYVDAVDGSSAVVRDTRKTTPGLRLLEKMAVVAGGGVNHRLGLFDALLVKDNHVLAAGGVADATRRAVERADGRPVEVEVTTIDEMDAAIEAGASEVLLDNFALDDLAIATARAPAEVVLEASGGITLDNIAEVAATGVHRIAVGALTHSAQWLDVALDVVTVDALSRPGAPVEEDEPGDEPEADGQDVEDDEPPTDRDTPEPEPEPESDDAPEDEPELADEPEVIGLDDPDPSEGDDLMDDLGLRDDTAVEELADADDDVPVPDDDLVDAFLDELERDAGESDNRTDG